MIIKKLVFAFIFVTFQVQALDFSFAPFGSQSSFFLPDNCNLEKHESGTVTCRDMIPDFSSFNATQLQNILKLVIYNCGPSVLSNQSFAGLDHLSILVIRQCKIIEIEAGTFYNLPNLLHLSIEDGDVSDIPNGVFCQTPSLRTLLLRKNSLSTGVDLGFESKCPVDTTKACGTNITAFSIAGNDYIEITNDLLCSLPNLEGFNASNNRINKIDPLAFSKLRNLEVLDLSNNSLILLDSNLFKNVTNLIQLDLSYNNFNYISSSMFKNLTKLSRLYLKGNNIEAIHKHAFNSLTSLTGLDISSNSLIKLDGIFNLLTKLSTLHLANNLLTTISSNSFFGLLGLNHLDLDNNSLVTISKDAFKYNPRLTVLSMNNNLLTEIPNLSYTRRLFAMYVSNNNISTLSETAFQNCSNVFFLDFSNNNIQSINNVTFQNMTYLLKLDLSNNSLSNIDNGSFDGLFNTKYLFLQNNNLTFEQNVYIDESGVEHMNLFKLARNLMFLNLSSNAISKFSYDWFPSSLIYLSLSNNSIWTLPFYDSFQDPTPHMHILDLSFNHIVKILPSQFPPSLDKLLLHRNKIQTVEANSFVDVSDLGYLYLHNNLLTTLPRLDMGINMPIITLRNNPWICDCKLSWLTENVKWPFLVYDAPLMKCQYLFNKTLDKPMPVFASDDHHFLCDFKTDPTNQATCLTYPYKAVCRYHCPVNCTCYHNIAWTVVKIDCSNARLTSLPVSIPNITRSYYLDGNNISFVGHSAFPSATFLKDLFLNSSKIITIENGTFSFAFNLETLHLEKNYLKALAIDVFKNLTLLKNLDLSFNQLEDLDPRVFDPLKSLQVLNLANNKLTSFPVWSFTELPSITSLGLNYNPWNCSCDFTAKYRDWLLTHIGKLVNMTQLTCSLNLDNGFTKNISLVFFNTTHCYQFQPSLLLAASVNENQSHGTVVALAVCLTVVGLLAAVILFVYRRELKLRVERRFGTRLL